MADDSTNYYDMIAPLLGLGLGGYGVYNQGNLGNQAEKGYQGAVNAAQPFQYQGPSPGYAASQTAGKQGMEDYYAQMGLGTSGALGKAEYDYGQRGINDDYWKQVNSNYNDRTLLSQNLANQGQFYGNAAGQGAGQNPFSGFTSGQSASQYAALIAQIFGKNGLGGQGTTGAAMNPGVVEQQSIPQNEGSYSYPQGYGTAGGNWGEPSWSMASMPQANSFYDTGSGGIPSFGSTDQYDFGSF
jgi:hypothetical protein